MKAIRIHNYGGPEVLRYEDVPRPAPGFDELLIKVKAASVNPADWKIRGGYLRELIPRTLPLIPGFDASGVVEAVGSGVTGFRKGDEVYASLADPMRGTYAEYAVARQTDAAFKPKSVDHVQAAAVPLAALTAWQGLFEKAQLVAGQKILIHGAAGGVGSFAVQLAKWKGASVIGTACGKNQTFLRELGVDEPIDYESSRFEDAARDVDAVLDTIGGDTQRRSWKVLKPDGILVSIAGRPSPEEAARHGVRREFLSAQTSSSQLAEIARLVDSGNLRPIVEIVLPLSQARRAHEMSQSGHARGKIVLKID